VAAVVAVLVVMVTSIPLYGTVSGKVRVSFKGTWHLDFCLVYEFLAADLILSSYVLTFSCDVASSDRHRTVIGPSSDRHRTIDKKARMVARMWYITVLQVAFVRHCDDDV